MYDETSPYADGAPMLPNPGGCANCGMTAPLIAPSNLCEPCRESFIKFPIPKWLWAFAAGILIMMIFGFARMGEFMSYSIHTARADKAMEEHKYMTAQKELQNVLKKFPDKVDLNMKLLIAASYNRDAATVQRLFAKLQNEPMTDQELMDEAQVAMNYFMVGNLDSATSMIFVDAFSKDSSNVVALALPMIDTITDPLFKANAYLTLTSICFDNKDYSKCLEMLDSVEKISPDNVGGMSLRAAVYRNHGKFDEAVSLLQKILAINWEDASTISQWSRTELKRSNDKQAAELAHQALDIAPDDAYSLETLSMVQYYAGKKDESFRTFDKIKKIENGTDSTISSRLYKIISGQEKYR